MKVFQGIMKFEIQNDEVIAMHGRDTDNEVVQFTEPLNLSSTHLEVFQKLELSIKEAVHRDITLACNEWNLISDYKVSTGEAYLVADDVYYTELVEEHMLNRSPQPLGLCAFMEQCI